MIDLKNALNIKYASPLGLTSQFSFCGIPFRLDTYSACTFSCRYCYSFFRGGNTYRKNIRPADAFLIISKIERALSRKDAGHKGLITEFLRRRVPLHFGGMSDPFPPEESDHSISLLVLKYLKTINYPIVISTKSILPATTAYRNVLAGYSNLIYQVSLSTTRDSLAAFLEPYCPPPSQRILSVKSLSNLNVITMIRWQPLIPNVSEDPESFFEAIKGTGIRHIIIEFLKLPVEFPQALSNLPAPMDGVSLYYKLCKAKIIGREYILPIKKRLPIISKAIMLAHKLGISIGIGDNDLHHLSSTNCCCGVDAFSGFENWYKYQMSYAVINNNGGKIKYDSIKNQWRPIGACDEFINSHSRIKQRYNKIEDYILKRWEDIDSDFNPSSYYQVNCALKRDNEGLRVFNIRKYK